MKKRKYTKSWQNVFCSWKDLCFSNSVLSKLFCKYLAERGSKSSLMLSMFRARNWTVLKPRVKVSSSYDPLAYFSDIFISGKNENTGKICKWIITWTDFSEICVKQGVGMVIPLDFQVCRDDYQCPMLWTPFRNKRWRQSKEQILM